MLISHLIWLLKFVCNVLVTGGKIKTVFGSLLWYTTSRIGTVNECYVVMQSFVLTIG